MPVEAHQCPSCGAPLQVADQKVATVCIYCNSALVVTRDAQGHGALEKDADVDEETVEKIKSMLLVGQRDQAIALFENATGRGREAAVDAIDEYASHIVQKAAFSGTMNWFGFVILGTGVAMAAGGVWIVVADPSMLFLGLIALFVGGMQVFMLGRTAVRTIKYLGATVGEAKILRHAYIGQMASVHSYRLQLEVAGPDGQSFLTELPFPVRETGRWRIREGTRFQVKYFPGRPGSVVFHQHVED